ncbi:hypothetical protein H0H93_016638 [Arthromyces matolae]|nr:hypothetical protein H0H93_016638 [Arthromyces matolae]
MNPEPRSPIIIPTEVQDHIIDLLYEGKATSSANQQALRVCALVSTRWLARSRKWLLRDREVVLYGGVDMRPRRKMAHLTTIVQSPYLTLTPYIRHVVIIGPNVVYRLTSAIGGTSDQYAECNQALERVLPFVKNARTLTIRQIHWEKLNERNKSEVASMRRITSVNMQFVPVSTVSRVLYQIYTVWATRIRMLDIDWVNPEERTLPLPDLKVHLPRLHTLRVGGRVDQSVGRTLLSPEVFKMMQSLQTISIRTFEEESLYILGRIRYLGSRLRHLELTVPVFWMYDISDDKHPLPDPFHPVPFPVTLHHNPNLRTLSFAHVVNLSRENWWISRIISTSSSKMLDVHLTVAIRINTVAAGDLSELEETLIGSDPTKRRILHIHPEETPGSEFEETLRDFLSLLNARGDLHFHPGELPLFILSSIVSISDNPSESDFSHFK